jgi:hypothetical protein
MNDYQFWQIISDSRSSFFEKIRTPNKQRMVETLTVHQTRKLHEILGTLSPKEIIDFYRIFCHLLDRAYTWDLWGAAYIMGGGCSDDGFLDFRAWLISMGKDVYEAAIQNPETLTATVERKDVEDFFFEQFSYVPGRVYEEMTGARLPRDKEIGYLDKPAGVRWIETELRERFPLLFARCNSRMK